MLSIILQESVFALHACTGSLGFMRAGACAEDSGPHEGRNPPARELCRPAAEDKRPQDGAAAE